MISRRRLICPRRFTVGGILSDLRALRGSAVPGTVSGSALVGLSAWGAAVARFVNPYTFVPQAPEPRRRPPAGHDMMRRDQLSGVLKITLTARTPLLIGGFSRRG